MNTKISRAGRSHPVAKRIVSLILSLAMLFSITAGIDLSICADVNQEQWGEWIYQDHNTGIHDENGDLIYDSSSVDIIGYCGNEKNLVIPNAINGRSVISIDGFENNCNINTVTIQSGIEIIDGFAFAGCSELTTVTIPSTVISIRYKAFYENSKLNDVFYNGTVEKWNNISISHQWVDDNDYLENAYIHCSDGVFNKPCGYYKYNVKYSEGLAYITGYFGQGGNIMIPSTLDGYVVYSISGIGYYANFVGETVPESVVGLTDICIPQGVKYIADSTFICCVNLKSITIPNSVISIGSSSFYGCTSLTDVYYTGTEYEWNNIKFNNDSDFKNDCLFNANIHFNSIKSKAFTDLKGFEYYSDFVEYTSVSNSFLKGTNPPEFTKFSPTAPITRAMLITILYRMAGEPYANGNPYEESPFTDITDTGIYYYDAACWALENGVTTETTFKPNNYVNREQTASFLFRYAENENMLGGYEYLDVNLSDYPDYDDISYWAEEAIQWANYNGMITGTQQGTVNPKGATQRIHSTKILYGFGKVCNIGNFE